MKYLQGNDAGLAYSRCRKFDKARENGHGKHLIEGDNDRREILVRQTRIERATPAFGGLYSIQLSYWRLGVILELIS